MHSNTTIHLSGMTINQAVADLFKAYDVVDAEPQQEKMKNMTDTLLRKLAENRDFPNWALVSDFIIDMKRHEAMEADYASTRENITCML